GGVGVVLFWGGLGGGAAAADPRRDTSRSQSQVHEPSPIEDDANLHDVQFVGNRQGGAVGDHGVIWHSEDGGESWSLQASEVSCSLRSVCFLSDRVGWAAGGGTAPYSRHSYGVVVATSDGGRAWTPLVGPPASAKTSDVPRKSIAAQSGDQPGQRDAALPRIRWIKFFSRDDGVAVGEGTGVDPSGAFSTPD